MLHKIGANSVETKKIETVSPPKKDIKKRYKKEPNGDIGKKYNNCSF